MNNATVFLLWLGQGEDRRMLCAFATRELAERALLGMALRDVRPVAPEIEEVAVVHHVPEAAPKDMA